MSEAEECADPSAAPRTALRALAERLDGTPSDPWIFWRPGWRWRWRSWAEMADQVARGAAVIEQAAETAPSPLQTIAFADRRDPDAVALSLAIQAADSEGRSEVAAQPVALADGTSIQPPDAPWDAWAAIEPSPGTDSAEGAATTPVASPGAAPPGADAARQLLLPSVRPRFERVVLERPTGQGGTLLLAGETYPAHRVASRAKGLAEALRRSASRRSNGRPILCAGPGLSASHHQVVLAATALAGAAWVLEGDPELFAATIHWARPTLVVADAASIHALLEDEAWNDRPKGRWQRWRGLWLTPGSVLEPDARAELETGGIEVTVWPANQGREHGSDGAVS